MSNTVAVGIDDQLHQFRFKPAAKSGSKKRKNTSKAALEHVKAEQSDFAKPVSTALDAQVANRSQQGDQAVVRYSMDGSHIATGGADGQIRIWASSTLKLTATLGTSGGEVLHMQKG